MKTTQLSLVITNEQSQKPTTELVQLHNGVPMTSSLQVAQYFGKDHHNVLRDIRRLECSSDFQALNFDCSFYISEIHNGGQKKQPLFYMTKDGFAFLVMGFTGKIAAQFKEDYINAFNTMEAHLKQKQLDERAILHKLKAYCDKRNAAVVAHRQQLHKETGTGVGLCDLMTALTFNEQRGLEENLTLLFPRIYLSMHEAWYFAHRSAQLEQEILKLKKAIQSSMSVFANEHRIYPESW